LLQWWLQQKAEDGKVLFLAPTKPLVDQHIDTFDDFIDLDRDEMYVMTGDTRPDKRYELWDEKRIFLQHHR